MFVCICMSLHEFVCSRYMGRAETGKELILGTGPSGFDGQTSMLYKIIIFCKTCL